MHSAYAAGDCQGRMHCQRVLCCCLISSLHTQRLRIFFPAAKQSRSEAPAHYACSMLSSSAAALSGPLMHSVCASSFPQHDEQRVINL